MSTFAIGDEVSLPQGHQAILRWIGRIPGRPPIEYAGVEVTGPAATSLGKHSGAYNGHQYFHTEKPGTGLFVSYTQLVSANVRTPRLGPPDSPSSAAGTSPASSPVAFGSPTFRAASPLRDTMSPRSIQKPRYKEESPIKPTSKELSESAAESAASLSMQRNFFRDALKATNEKVSELTAEFEAKLEEVKTSYEDKLKKARRSSSLLSGPTEVEQQRQALAAMQNTIISERKEKQDEIDNLKSELMHMRKLAGSVEDLEALVGDLAKYERELTELRSQVNEMDSLKEEMAKLRSQNAELALAARSNSAGGGSSSTSLTQLSHPNFSADNSVDHTAEIARLEKMLEQKLVRESELELENEQLQQEVKRIKASSQRSSAAVGDAASQPATPESDPLEEDEHAKVSSIRTAQHIPVPPVLNGSYDESSMMVDVAAGRSDWCSLCEREGHSAVDCPYE